MKYIDKNLKPIAEFVMDYANWDVRKDEWNRPMATVPLFRVLDALVQKGKQYVSNEEQNDDKMDNMSREIVDDAYTICLQMYEKEVYDDFINALQEKLIKLAKKGEKDKFIKELIAKLKGLEYPYVTAWRKNNKDNKPNVKQSVLMLTNHGVAEGEWLGDEWIQYKWSCKSFKDEDVLYWLHLSDLETLEKEGELKEENKQKLVWEFCDKSLDAYEIILNEWKTLTDEDKNKYNQSIDFNDSNDK